MILRGLRVGHFDSNCFIIGSEEAKAGLVIDPGGDADAILDLAHKMGLYVKLIVATHSHIDHIGAVRQVQEATKAPFAMHQGEIEGQRLRGRGGLSAITGFPEVPTPDRFLQDGEVLEIGELRLTVLHTPGHSLGGISIAGYTEGVVFTGDTLFNLGIGRTDFPGCSFEALMRSIFTKLMVLPDDTLVLPGHGPETSIGQERQWNSFLQPQHLPPELRAEFF